MVQTRINFCIVDREQYRAEGGEQYGFHLVLPTERQMELWEFQPDQTLCSAAAYPSYNVLPFLIVEMTMDLWL